MSDKRGPRPIGFTMRVFQLTVHRATDVRRTLHATRRSAEDESDSVRGAIHIEIEPILIPTGRRELTAWINQRTGGK